RHLDYLVVSSAAEAQHVRQLGVAESKIDVLPPGVAPCGTTRPAPESLGRSLGLPAGARLLMGAGPLEPHKGFRDAIWAFDILKYLGHDWHLILIGDGPERARLEAFTRAIGAVGHVHFVDPRADVPELLAQAEVVWVPSRADSGVQVALEAMAAGRPVIASRMPGLAEVVVDGETGFLIPPGDKVALARQTRVLMEDAQLRDRMGAAGRERAGRRFAAPEWVRHWVRLYEAALAS